MPRYGKARWRPISGHTDGPMRAHVGAVLHVNQSNGNLFNWFNGDHNVSAHFEVYKNGAIEQYLDTNVSSWCQADGNPTYVSIETEGFTTEPLTSAQLHALAGLMAWLHTVHGIPLRLAEHPGERGLGWHGMGGVAWGGHTGCPGEKRKAQRATVLELARKQLGDPKPVPAPPTPAPAPAPPPAKGPSVPPDGYRYKLYTAGGAVFASAPGRWRKVDANTIRSLILHAECAAKIQKVHAVTLARLRAVAIGHNS